MRTLGLHLLVAVVLAGGAGCYPEDSGPPLAVSIPLKDLGISLSPNAVRNVTNWLASRQQALTGSVFDMDDALNTFYLGLRLENASGSQVDTTLVGQGVAFDEKTGTLDAYLALDTCSFCHFNLVFFWKDGTTINTYSGVSDTFSSIGGQGGTADVTAQLYPTGLVRCQLVDFTGPENIQIAARDAAENVRFPHVVSASKDGGYEVELPWMPVGRQMKLDYSSVKPVNYYPVTVWKDSLAVDPIDLSIAGETVNYTCKP